MILGNFLCQQLVPDTFFMPDQSQKQLIPVILYWLGDHKELNVMVGVYGPSCRKCFKQRDPNAPEEWLLRDETTRKLSYAQLESSNSVSEISKLTYSYQQHLPIHPLGVLQSYY